MATKFEWDPAKAASNLKKHRVGFETALRAFADPFAMAEQDRIENGEHRWQTLGMVDGYLLLVVIPCGKMRTARKSFASFRHAGRNRKKGNAMRKTVRHAVDLSNLPPLTEQQKAELRALSEMQDSEIDYSDIPALEDAFWKNAIQNRSLNHRQIC